MIVAGTNQKAVNIPESILLVFSYKLLFGIFSYNRGADPRASQSGPVPCSGARRQNKVLDEVSAAILGGVAAENVSVQRRAAQRTVRWNRLLLAAAHFLALTSNS